MISQGVAKGVGSNNPVQRSHFILRCRIAPPSGAGCRRQAAVIENGKLIAGSGLFCDFDSHNWDCQALSSRYRH
jgi:hypothetical protein